MDNSTPPTFEDVMHIAAKIDTEKNAGLMEFARIIWAKSETAERERCAALVDALIDWEPCDCGCPQGRTPKDRAAVALMRCAAAIRATKISAAKPVAASGLRK